MPELPDLQVFSRNLTKELKGKTVKRLTIVNKKKLKTPVAALKKALEGGTLTTVEREGKELHFKFSNGNMLGMHLMLNGNLYLYEKKHDKKYRIVEMLFDDETGLVLTDFQGMANVMLNPEERTAPDALSKEVNYKWLKGQLEKKKGPIKTVLMDQKVIRGIGNAYADEILWDARISPVAVSNSIPDEKLKALVKSIKSVLKNAEKQILKKNPDLISGEVRDFLLIHNAKREKSPTGGEILTMTISGRKTYYTEEQEEWR